MSQDNKPREWTVYRSYISGTTSCVAHNFHWESELNKTSKDSFYHVIEFAAYQELLKQNEELKQKLEVARNTLKAIASLKIEDFKSHYELSGKLDLIEILELDALDARQALKEIGE